MSTKIFFQVSPCGAAAQKGPDKKASRNAARQASGLFAEVMICRNAREREELFLLKNVKFHFGTFCYAVLCASDRLYML
jgi:hypothetical protein